MALEANGQVWMPTPIVSLRRVARAYKTLSMDEARTVTFLEQWTGGSRPAPSEKSSGAERAGIDADNVIVDTVRSSDDAGWKAMS